MSLRSKTKGVRVQSNFHHLLTVQRLNQLRVNLCDLNRRDWQIERKVRRPQKVLMQAVRNHFLHFQFYFNQYEANCNYWCHQRYFLTTISSRLVIFRLKIGRHNTRKELINTKCSVKKIMLRSNAGFA